MSVDYDRLYFDSIQFTSLEDGINPHFHCPLCSNDDHSKRFWFNPKLSLGTTFPTIFDFNQQIAVPIPSHNDPKTGKRCGGANHKITLYIAVHKDVQDSSYCISVEPIRVDWWVRSKVVA